MASTKKEVVPGLTSTDIRIIAAKILNKKDGNHPQSSRSGNDFIDILKNGKSDISVSSAFIKKVNL